MIHSNKSLMIATGFAMFSMFFGAGNVVFPLALGQLAQNQNFFAIMGMLITAVGVPFTGLIAMTLFDGNYTKFFARLGVVPGFLIAAFIMGLIGPFGAMPRCIALSFSTAKMLMPNASLPVFSAIACFIVWLFTFRPNSILDTLGYVLTPILLGSLGIIIVKGILSSPEAIESSHDNFKIFLQGMKDGYLTMDLLGAFFFSSVVIMCLKKEMSEGSTPKQILRTALKSAAIGAFLLSIVYVGFSYVAALNSTMLVDTPPDELISQIALHVLGKHASIIACIAVVLATLTTAIALGAVFAEFIHKDLTFGKVSYGISLVITLFVTFLVSTLNFQGIAAFLAPILQICYPALIVLSVLNILYKLYNFKPVVVPVLAVFVVTLAGYLLV